MSNNLKFYINGNWVDPIEGTPCDVINPATEEPCGQIMLASTADVDAAIDSRDKSVAKIADLITNPGWIASLLFKIIRITEKGTVAEKIQKLID